MHSEQCAQHDLLETLEDIDRRGGTIVAVVPIVIENHEDRFLPSVFEIYYKGGTPKIPAEGISEVKVVGL